MTTRCRMGLPTLIGVLGALVVLGCGDPPSLVGQACQTDDHCGTEAGQALTCDHAIPGGYCTLTGCDPESPQACPKGAMCVTEADATACRQVCKTVLDCREVIACNPDPDCDPAQEKCGQVCENAMACVGLPAATQDGPEQGTCQFTGR